MIPCGASHWIRPPGPTEVEAYAEKYRFNLDFACSVCRWLERELDESIDYAYDYGRSDRPRELEAAAAQWRMVDRLWELLQDHWRRERA